MKNINSHRVFKRNECEPNREGEFVLYWMQINRRVRFNYALEYAVAHANKLNKPLLILEAFSSDYPWASARTHTFVLQGMKEHLNSPDLNDFNYLPFVELATGEYNRLLMKLIGRSCLVVTDEYPVFIMRKRNSTIPANISVPYYTVDSNGLIPLGLTKKDPYTAYLFRKTMQRNFIEAFTAPPKEHPLQDLKNRSVVSLPESFLDGLPDGKLLLDEIDDTVSKIAFPNDVKPIALHGGREAALRRMNDFLYNDLPNYGEKRNDPDEQCTSGLSPWLHFGKISEYEIVKEVLSIQPERWDLDRITYNNGSRDGFFNGDPNIDGFLDELITWREVGFHFAHHREDFDQFSSLPDWALETLNEHRNDPREWNYSYEELEQSSTHDELWNAAQTQLREEGVIHNYLRMLWGKKVLEWTPDPETALNYLIDLNNIYAIDGRDPNSYSGIFWCFGRFDRAWQERAVFGKIRYMSSDNTRKKVKMKQYLQRYGTQRGFL